MKREKNNFLEVMNLVGNKYFEGSYLGIKIQENGSHFKR